MRVCKYYLEEGGRIPRGYGVAYIDIPKRQYVCYPIPFNYIINLLRKAYYALMGPSMPELERRIDQAYHEGKIKGWRLREKRFKEDMERLLKEREDELRRKYG